MTRPWRLSREGSGVGRVVIYTYVRALWFVLVDWLLDDLDDQDGVPETCDWCRVERPPDPLSWERWELVHEHLERAW